MRAWFYFWIAAFVVSTALFAGIAAVIAVRGVGDLRAMLKALSRGEEGQ